MARKRMIDPEFWSDEEIGQWSRSARLLYIGLWNFADDCGRFKASVGLLKGQIFPYDDPKSLKIQRLLEEVSSKIEWYQVNGSQYGYIRNFNKHQRIDRPLPSKLPPPPSQISTKLVEPSTNVPPNRREENIIEEKRRSFHLSDEEFIDSLKTKQVYKHIDIDTELEKMDSWIMVHPGRKKTQRFIVNWLNKIDKPLGPQKKYETKPKKDCDVCKGTGYIKETKARCFCW